jgi:hypothetical protein
MWANTVWGLLGFGMTLAGARLSMLWTHDYEWIAPWLTGASISCFMLAFAVFIWPFSRPKERLKSDHVVYSLNQSGGQTAQTIINNTDKSAQEELQNLITGGDSFCLFLLAWFDVEKNIAKNIAVGRIGKYAAHDVRLRIVNMHNQEEKHVYVGELGGGGTARSIELPGVWALTDNCYYRIFFSARNGIWRQDYILKKSIKEGYWPSATRVIWQDGRIKHEKIDSKYVEEFGEPAWLS